MLTHSSRAQRRTMRRLDRPSRWPQFLPHRRSTAVHLSKSVAIAFAMHKLSAVRESLPLRYGLAVAVVVIAAALRVAITPVFGDRNELLFFYPAIMVAAWFGGLGPGLISTGFSAATAAYLFLEPRRTLLLTHASDRLALVLFVAVGCVIAALNDNLHRGVLREQEARRASEQARGEAAAANRSKDFFLAAVSHDLRAPTTAITGWAQMLQMGMLEPAKQQRAAESILQTASHQIKLLDDLLDTAAILSGGLRIEPRTVDLRDVVRSAAEVVAGSASAKRINIRIARPSEPATVEGDAMRLQQVVWNLLTNAVKFTPEGGTVDLSIACGRSEALLEVRDTGRGIPPDAIPHVFDRFWQGDRRSDIRHGVGLGLGIAKHLVEAHRGTIVVSSAGEGRGTTFSVRLPRSSSASPAASV